MARSIDKQGGVDISSFRTGVGDMPMRYLWPMALGLRQPKYLRLFQREAVPHLNPSELHGIFSESDAQEIIGLNGVWKGFYEIADIVGSRCFDPIQQALRAQTARPDEQPFDLTMTVAHMFDGQVGPIESAPCNVAQMFPENFDVK